MKEKILALKAQNPSWGYQRIANEIGCSKKLVQYHLRPELSEKLKARMSFLRKRNPLLAKRSRFCQFDNTPIASLAIEEIEKKIGPNPVCYLTGRAIDISDSSSFSFDHMIPLCQGGTSTIENLGLTSSEVNICKNGFTPEQFFDLCKEVLSYQGYTITK